MTMIVVERLSHVKELYEVNYMAISEIYEQNSN